MTETSTDLIDTTKITAVDIFEKDDGVEGVLNMVRQAVADFVPDLTTRQGRLDIKSIAARVATSKVWLDGQGKEMVDAMKAVTGAIDAKRKTIRDTLDALKIEVRKPLTEWEEAEELRVAEHKKGLAWISGVGADALLNWDTMSLDVMRTSWGELRLVEERDKDSWEEFADEAAVTLARAFSDVTSALEKRTTHDAEKAEVERLREEAAEREKADREAADQKRQEERDAQVKKDLDAAKAEALRDAREKADAAAEQAEKDRVEAAEQSERDQELATLKERERIEAEQEAQAKAERERAADENHRNQCEAAAIKALMSIVGMQATMDESTANGVIAAIANGHIPNVKITY